MIAGAGMWGLFAAFGLFVALHSIPAVPAIKSRIVWTIGRPAYIAVYSIVSTAALVWLFYEALNTDYIELWSPAAWQVRVTLIAAPLGLFMVISGLLSRNPFSVTLRHDADPAGAIVGITRHPVLWGFFTWSAGHVFPNGDLRSLTLFGGFATFSLGGLWMAERRGRRKLGTAWTSRAQGTSFVPFVSSIKARRVPRMDMPMIIGAAITIAFVTCLLNGGHAALFGADPLQTLGAL